MNFLSRKVPVAVDYKNITIYGLNNLVLHDFRLYQTKNRNIVISMFATSEPEFQVRSRGNIRTLGNSGRFYCDASGRPDFEILLHYNMRTLVKNVKTKDRLFFRFHLIPSRNMLETEILRQIRAENLQRSVHRVVVNMIRNVVSRMNLRPMRPAFEKVFVRNAYK